MVSYAASKVRTALYSIINSTTGKQQLSFEWARHLISSPYDLILFEKLELQSIINGCGYIYIFFLVLDESPESGSEEDEEDPDITEAVNELVPDLATEDEEAYLNLSLEEETSIIAEYRTLLLSAGHSASSNVVTS